MTGVTIQFLDSDKGVNRLVFGTEAIDTPMEITLISPVGCATIVGSGNGRFEVR